MRICVRVVGAGCAIYISLQHGSPAFDENSNSLNSTPSRQQGSRAGSTFVPSTPERAAYIASRRISVDYLGDAGSHSSAQVPTCSCAACCQVLCCLPTQSFLDSLPQQVFMRHCADLCCKSTHLFIPCCTHAVVGLFDSSRHPSGWTRQRSRHIAICRLAVKVTPHLRLPPPIPLSPRSSSFCL